MKALVKPGSAHLALIATLLSEFDNVNIAFDRTEMRANQVDSLTQRMFTTSKLLGLCSDDGFDIITGTATEERQVRYLTMLAELVECAQKERSCSDKGLSLREGALLRALASESLDAVFSPSVSLFPADVMQSIVVQP